MKLIDIAPIGTREGLTFHGTFTMQVYPDSPGGRAFRDARVAAGLTLGEMARRLGLRPAELSAVERGSMRPENWHEFFAAAGLER